MTNEQYLVVSYFTVAALCSVAGILAYAWLRSSLNAIAGALPWQALRNILVRLFPVGIVFPALMGFFAVSYQGCNISTYKEIIAQRSHLVATNHRQLSSSLYYLAGAVFLWGSFVTILLAFARRSQKSRRNFPQ
jgi:hypothetical protein